MVVVGAVTIGVFSLGGCVTDKDGLVDMDVPKDREVAVPVEEVVV